jgi:hypothetical protein
VNDVRIDGTTDLNDGDIITFGGGVQVKPLETFRQPDSEFSYLFESFIPESRVASSSQNSSQNSQESLESHLSRRFSFLLFLSLSPFLQHFFFFWLFLFSFFKDS